MLHHQGSRSKRRPSRLKVARCRGKIVFRQIECKATALINVADKPDLSAQQCRELSADGQPKTGAAIAAAGSSIGLVEGLENDSLLVGRDADTRVTDLKRDHSRAFFENRVFCAPARLSHSHAEDNASMCR